MIAITAKKRLKYRCKSNQIRIMNRINNVLSTTTSSSSDFKQKQAQVKLLAALSIRSLKSKEGWTSWQCEFDWFNWQWYMTTMGLGTFWIDIRENNAFIWMLKIKGMQSDTSDSITTINSTFNRHDGWTGSADQKIHTNTLIIAI